MTACPVGAIHVAGATLAQLEAQLAVLLADPLPAGVLFACAGAVETLDEEPALDDWAVVELPALALATPGWVLQALAGGAPARSSPAVRRRLLHLVAGGRREPRALPRPLARRARRACDHRRARALGPGALEGCDPT